MRAFVSALAGLGCFTCVAAAQDVALAPHKAGAGEQAVSATAPTALVGGTAVHIPMVQELLADRAIRDHVGLSENSWDFSSPDGVPGFAAMPADDTQTQIAAAASSGD
jgi:hypothetical protein